MDVGLCSAVLDGSNVLEYKYRMGCSNVCMCVCALHSYLHFAQNTHTQTQ